VLWCIPNGNVVVRLLEAVNDPLDGIAVVIDEEAVPYVSESPAVQFVLVTAHMCVFVP
jgi:hypothetical protein